MKALRSQNYYEILGISRYASPDEIRNAYELSKLTFTQNSLATYSLFSEEENEEILDLISKAYETLLNPEMRREYDTFLDAGGQGSHHAWEARKPAGRGAPMPPRPQQEPLPGEPGMFASRSALPGMASPPRREASARETFAPRDASSRESATREMPARDAAPAREPAAREPVVREAVAREAATLREPPGREAPAREPAAEAKPKPAPAPAAPAAPRQTEADRFVASLQSYPGETLRRVRELRGMSIFEMCSQTKIRQTYVEYIEQENFAGLPAPVYIRGFVKLMAASLGLPPEEAAADYMSRYRAGKRA